MNNFARLLAFPVSNFNRVGCLSEKKQPKILLLIMAIIMGSVFFDLIVLVAQFFYMEDNFEYYVKNCDGIAFLTQGFTKWFFCVYYKKEFIDLIKCSDYFWNAKECAIVKQGNIEKLIKSIVFAQKTCTSFIVIANLCGTIMSLYTGEIMAGYWSMGNKKILHAIVWASLLINTQMQVCLVSFFDGLFVGCCYEAIIQCKLLCNRLEQLSVKKIDHEYNEENYKKDLGSCVKHHILILSFHSQMQNIFSIPLMIQYITIVPYLIVEMYIITELSTFSARMYLIVEISCAIFQISLYCLSANELTDELLSISDAAYNSDWYSKRYSFVSKSIALMMVRAQRPETLTACGLIEFNREILVKILKFGASTGIALRNIKNSHKT